MEKARAARYSIVIPLFNEEDNLRPLYTKVVESMEAVSGGYQIVFVDDGSSDRTYSLLREICANDGRVMLVRLRRNFGQTTALQAGFDYAEGEVIISLDGDLQHDPAEIPQFIAKINEGYDLVSGWRVKRQDTWLTRRLPSRIANWMMAKLSGVDIHDFGTTFKAYRREILQQMRLYGDHHRFIPALASSFGARIAEIPIKNIPRTNGKSNYGLSRTIRVMLDLVSIKFLLEYSTRPLQFFGLFGFAGLGVGSLIGL
ncbi:MAG TPA: glycosyltransferase family 2 protein, partial [Terriglobia bacterium]|nr:glycosyltransferase family 2 protein [Terriglobia bacterium]